MQKKRKIKKKPLNQVKYKKKLTIQKTEYKNTIIV